MIEETGFPLSPALHMAKPVCRKVLPIPGHASVAPQTKKGHSRHYDALLTHPIVNLLFLCRLPRF